MPEQNALIALNKLTLQRSGATLLTDIRFQLNPGECWAVVGPMGSGKTTFLRTMAGQFPTKPGLLSRHATVEFVSFKEESQQFTYSGLFYQQRYQATMGDDRDGKHIPTLRDFVQLTDTSESKALIERLGLDPLLDRSFLKLSNGQARKARIVKALLRHPTVLLLDNPYVGLDTASRLELNDWLGELIQHGMGLMLVTDADTVPSFVSHVIALHEGRVDWAGPRDCYKPKSEPVLIPAFPVLETPAGSADFREVFRLQAVTVRYNEITILKAVNWTVRAGERWALVGPNGAGKSVLLSLLYGDHPQAYANDVSVFGHRRGKAGESIWDVKRRIGFVSPELHLYFPQHLSVRQVALTALTDTLTVPARVPANTEADLNQLLTYFEIRNLADRSFGSLSTGEQRLVLLIRALLKNSPVLLLDEPFQALDARHIELARQYIDNLSNKTILFITHDRRELPASVSQVFSLNRESV
ncbi:ATP-binding cassette domain-containing protein [Spirosoma soli]|uniref:ATP-binding cassette domain-containing protein n=1 Tax=Spirosoma soli TaxID=1770529 RepID=A0ABW5M4K0_9BACT